MLSDVTLRFGEILTPGLLGVDAVYSAGREATMAPLQHLNSIALLF